MRVMMRSVNELISEWIAKGWVSAKPATVEMIGRVERALDCRVPDSYREFLLLSDGIEGAGPGYLRLLGCEKMCDDNNGYQVGEYLPGYLMIGSDGGSCFYFMRKNSPHDSEVFMLLSGAFFEDEAESMGPFGEAFVRRCIEGGDAK